MLNQRINGKRDSLDKGAGMDTARADRRGLHSGTEEYQSSVRNSRLHIVGHGSSDVFFLAITRNFICSSNR